MYPITVPTLRWFEYQMWLTQNYMYPLINYYAHPDGWSTMLIEFNKESDRDRFEERWKHTLE